MKYKILPALAASLLAGNVCADDVEKDTIKVVDVEEILIIATPKENRKLRELPIAASLLSQESMRANHVASMKNLTGIVPNLYIPDYGSKLTSSIYLRGIGSRVNTPSVGMYVDNIPYLDKSAFDFSYADVERIDVLRGPQGTLYGRNTMGGLIRVHTQSPFTYQGTDIRLGAASYGDYNASLTHYHRISSQFAFSAGGFFERKGGFFENAARNYERIDRGTSGGGRMRGIWLPTDNFKADLSVSYEYGDQGGYPYRYTGVVSGTENRADRIGVIAYNDRSTYRRGLFNTGLNLEYQGKCFTISAVTGYQHLKDRLFMDQDFSEEDLYNLTQKQRSHSLSEEIVLKSKSGRRWEWTTGVFGFYQWQHTSAPVVFQRTGIANLIEGNTNAVFRRLSAANPNVPLMSMNISNSTFGIGGEFDTPTMNGAVYHQSTLNDLLLKGLSLTAGLRLDYERTWMDYRSATEPMLFTFNVAGRPITGLKAENGFTGDTSSDYLQLLPKVALQYEWKPGNNIYATVSKGYRSGGYSIQMFSDLIQSSMMNSVIDALAAHPALAPMASRFTAYKTEVPEVATVTKYNPEYSWNYEVGSRLTFFDERLTADLAAFYMDTHDQQISQFSAHGLGRTTVNAGRSRSYGAEAALRASLNAHVNLQAAYGYTYATFTDYVVRQQLADGTYKEVTNYNGHYVPFTPKHTLNVGAEYAFVCSSPSLFDRITFQVNYQAAGRIYWTESNRSGQAFYGTLNGRANLEMGGSTLSFWARNFLDKKYDTFYFESMNRGFAQQGRPAQFGVELRCRF